jgi:putrescine transport system substrate-binding protein
MEAKFVNVYCFAGIMPHAILRQFEQETGIKVRLDLYDNSEILEAKLLTTNSGYDVVMPTSPPYLRRQILAGVYQPLQKDLLPNLKDLHPIIMEKMKNIDPSFSFSVPYIWATVGVAFDYDVVSKLLPDVDLESHELIFNPDNLKVLATHGVSFFEEAIDVFPAILHYLGKDPNQGNYQDLEAAYQHLRKLRDYLSRFASSRFINDLIQGDICLAQAWSGEAQQAIQEAKEIGRDIRYFAPKEGAGMWVDSFAIPKGAEHPTNAHIFINFMLRPDIAAKFTNEVFVPTTVIASLPFVEESLKKNSSIYPPKETMKKIELYQLPPGEGTTMYERERNRLWAKIRSASSE